MECKMKHNHQGIQQLQVMANPDFTNNFLK